jgi:hypothetical protein
VLGTPSPAVTPTNLLYNVVATPGALYRYWRQGQTGGRLALVLRHLLADPEARYTELGPDWHARKTDTDRRTRSLLNQLRALHPDSDITITAA